VGVRLELHIDEIVLHGFSPHDRHALGDAIATALREKLTGAAPTLAATGDAAQLDAGSIAVGKSPGATGAAIASAVASALGGQR
jgi:hypothetical protein